MPKITEHDRQIYNENIKSYAAMANALLKNEKDILAKAGADLQKLTLADEMLNLASNYIAINGVSQAALRTKNEEALNDGRKSLYKAVIYLEGVVTNLIDAPFSEYENKLTTIESFDANQRYNLIRKMGLAVDLLEHAYGDNSKWRWTFVDLEGRFAAVAKNIVDLRNALANSRPDSQYYESTVYHLRLVKKLLAQSADRYREKYELSTGQILDFKTGISFLAALKRIHTILAESEDAEAVKKRLSIWTQKLDTDEKKKEEAKKKR